MRAIYKRLILAFAILSVLKIGLSFLIPSPSVFADEYFYSSMARTFLKDGTFRIFGYFSNTNPPLYPIFLSIAYIFKDMRVVYMIFKVINALLSSLIILPTWLLVKEFLNERKAFWVALLCCLVPAVFVLSFFVMAENLFYTLFLFAVYFVYRSFTEKDIKLDFLAGLFLGLTYLSRILGVILVFSIFILLLYSLIKKDYSQIKRKILLYVISLLVVLPWLIRNTNIFGRSLSGLAGLGYSNELSRLVTNFSWFSMFYWILMYFAFLVLACGIILFVFSLLSFKTKDEKTKILSILVWAIIICFVLFISIRTAKSVVSQGWLLGRPMGRYIAITIPLMLILSFINLKLKENFYKYKMKYIIFCSLLIIASFKLFSFNLYPVNAISVSYIGLLDFGLKYLIGNFSFVITTMLAAAFVFYLLLIKYINFKKLLYLVGVFFIITNIVSFSMVYYNSNYRWSPLDQMQLGLWFNDNISSTNSKVLFDDRDNEKPEYQEENILKAADRRMSRAAFWMNAYAEINNIDKADEYDYVVSKHDLDYELVKQIGEFRLYKTK